MSTLHIALRSLTLLVLLASGCGDASGGSGSCGAAAEGTSCTTTDECACALTCVDGACVEVYGEAAGQQTEEEPAPLPVTTAATSLCNVAVELGCEDDASDCQQRLSRGEQYFDDYGCGSAWRDLATCIHPQADSCETLGSPFDLDNVLGSGMCPSEAQGLIDCINGACIPFGGVCSSDAEAGCTLSYENSCGQVSGASCQAVEGAADPRLSCTCGDDTANPGNTFQVYADSCCQTGLAAHLEAACGFTSSGAP